MRYLAILVCLAGGPALATEFEAWGESGAWSILVNPSVGYGCFAQRSFNDGVVVQIGAEPARDGGFFILLQTSPAPRCRHS